MNSLKLSILSVILTINLLLQCYGALGVTASRGDLTSKEKSDVDNMIRDVMRASEVTGVGLSLVRNGRVIYSQGYGTADLARMARTTRNTVFCQAQITETFTAALLSSLLASAGLDWDTRVKTILGDDFYLHNPLVSEEVTLKDLMAHASGIANNEAALINAESGYKRMVTRAMFAPMVQPFRTSRVYSVVGMAIIQKVIERLGNDTWQELLEQRILRSLRMTSTFHVNAPEQTRLRFAKPVMKVGRNREPVPWELISVLQYAGTAGSVCASPDDMGRWLLFHLEKGFNDQGQRIFPSNIITELYDGVVKMGSSHAIPPEALSQPNIPFAWRRDMAALGWVIGYYRQFRTLSQAGSWYGYESMTSMIPEQRVGVSVSFVGRVGPKVEAAKALVNMYMLDILLRTKLWVTDVPEVITNIVSKIVVPREDAPPFRNDYPSMRDRELYEGVYGNGYNGRVWIKIHNESTNTLTLEYGEVGHYILYPTRTKDRFFMRPAVADPLQFLTKTDVFRRLGTDTVMFEFSEPKESKENGDDLTGNDNDQDTAMDEEERPSNGHETMNGEEEAEDEPSVISIVVPTFNKAAPPVFLKDFNLKTAFNNKMRRARLCSVSTTAQLCSLAAASTSSLCLVMVSLLLFLIRIA